MQLGRIMNAWLLLNLRVMAVPLKWARIDLSGCPALALLMTRVNTVMAPLTPLQPSTNMGVDRVREYYVLVKVPGSNVD